MIRELLASTDRPEIGLVDFGGGNLASIVNMLARIGARSDIVSDARELGAYSGLIIPGVGAFDQGIQGLSGAGLSKPLTEIHGLGRVPILGICLGMELMFEGSDEGTLPGLGWFDGRLRRFDTESGNAPRRLNMGWRDVEFVDSVLTPGGGQGSRFYFAHSYHLPFTERDDALAFADHGSSFICGVQKGATYGVQFHPEKSHAYGRGLLKQFVDLVRGCR